MKATVYWMAIAESDGADTRKAAQLVRSLGQNPRMAIHVGFGDEVVIVEGSAKSGLSDVPFLTHRRSHVFGNSGAG